MLEDIFVEFMETVPNGKRDKDGDIYSFYRKAKNSASLSYHLIMVRENLQYNFWYCKIREQVSISLCDNSQKHEKDKLSNVLVTKNINDLKKFVCSKL